jgi:hypothetical protein
MLQTHDPLIPVTDIFKQFTVAARLEIEIFFLGYTLIDSWKHKITAYWSAHNPHPKHEFAFRDVKADFTTARAWERLCNLFYADTFRVGRRHNKQTSKLHSSGIIATTSRVGEAVTQVVSAHSKDALYWDSRHRIL